MGGEYPGGFYVRGLFSWGAIILGGDYPGGECLGGDFPGGRLSWGAIIRGVNVSGAFFFGGEYPGAYFRGAFVSGAIVLDPP